jgi:hypothetical protein
VIRLADGVHVYPVCGAFNEEKHMSEEQKKQESAVVAFVIAQANDEQLLSMAKQLLGAVLQGKRIEEDERIAIRTADSIVQSVLEVRYG